MRRYKQVACVALLVCGACWAQGKRPFVVLPPSQAQALNHLCSRSVTPEVDRGWELTASDVAALEARLRDVSKMRSRTQVSISDPFHYDRQYFGIVAGGKHLIYVNAFSPDAGTKYWRTRLVDVCDGGSSFWGVVFDPVAGNFSDLETNGPG